MTTAPICHWNLNICASTKYMNIWASKRMSILLPKAEAFPLLPLKL